MKKLLFIPILILALASLSWADVLIFELNYEFSGGTPPSGLPPWLTATFDDSVGPDKVRLTMSASGLTDPEFVDGQGWLFNLNPALNPTALSFSYISGNDADSIFKEVNAFKADGDGYFDIQFSWDPKPDSRLTAGQTVVYDISGITGLVASDFNFYSYPSGGAGIYHTAAHVQGIGPDDLSGWIGDGVGAPPQKVPEPTTLLLIGSGLGFLAGYAKRRVRK